MNNQTSINDCLYELCQRAEREDSEIRKRMLRIWKRHDKFWHGIMQVYWSETHQDWLAPTDLTGALARLSDMNEDDPEYDYVINIFKAHGESIIAALGAQVPVVRFVPDNAERDEDLIAAKAYSKISDLLATHNRAKLLQLKILLHFWIEGMCCVRVDSEESEEYGTYMDPTYKHEVSCPNCGVVGEATDEQMLAAMPDDESVPNTAECPTCKQAAEVVSTLTAEEQKPKSRVLFDVFGPLNVKLPYYARSQKECSYLILYQDLSPGQIIEMFPELLEEGGDPLTGESEVYERSARTPSAFGGITAFDGSDHLCTLKLCWLRPNRFYELGFSKKAEINELRAKYPKGCCVAYVGSRIVSVYEDSLDATWVIGKANLSRYIHSDAIGAPLIPVQEMVNTLANLSIDTIEHGIPITYADEDVVDFDALGKTTVKPGTTVPIRPKTGQTTSQAFYESSRPTLGKEVNDFAAWLEKIAQFVTGSFPSIYGGDDNSNTASQYAQSRQMALQRLSIVWTHFKYLWCDMMHLGVKSFIVVMVEDEKITKMVSGSYVTTWIRRAELIGKIGSVEPEGDESFPMTAAQKQSTIIKLLEMNNDFLNQAIFDPANRSLVAMLLGFPDFEIPGEAQRLKQLLEIQLIIQGAQIAVEVIVDDHEMHIESITLWAASLVGQEVKKTDPMSYQNVMMHLEEHLQARIQKELIMNPLPPQAAAPPAAPGDERKVIRMPEKGAQQQ